MERKKAMKNADQHLDVPIFNTLIIGTGHSSQLCYIKAMLNYIVKAICDIKRDKRIKAINVRGNIQSVYLAKVKKDLTLTVWQTGGCSRFYKKNDRRSDQSITEISG